MKRMMTTLLVLLSAPTFAKPKLLVVVSVDQMRADYLERGFTQGFKRLKDEGAVYTNAFHDHVPTETGPGHAAILTGQRPGRTGIVGNDWWDRALGREVYVVYDSVHGLGPEHLLAYTLGDALKAADPESRVVSVSVKDRAAILMGGKRPDAALWYDRKTGHLTTSSYYQRPRWLEKLDRRLHRKGGPLESAATPEGAEELVYHSSADAAVLLLAEEALSRFALGRDEHPDILAVGFSATDYVGHRNGFEGPEMSEHLRLLDGTVAELLAAAERAAGKGNFDLVLTADHGVTPRPEDPRGQAQHVKRVMFDDLGAEVEKQLQGDYPSKEPWVVNDYPNLYLSTTNWRGTGLDWRALQRHAAKLAERAPDVAKAYVPGEIDPGEPFAAVYERSVLPGRSGDLVIRVKEGVLVTDRPTGADHGTPYENDRRVPLIFWGPDFLPGTHGEPTPVVDLAPTCAALLGVPLPYAEGAARQEALR